MLVAATNPCPCGFAGVDDRCRCTPGDLARHARRLSGPLIDRLDLLVSVHRPAAAELGAPALRTSAEVRARVLAARERQTARLADSGKHRNGQLDARLVAHHVRLDAGSDALLARAYDRDGLSARAHLRILRVARTLADLAGRDSVAREDIITALAYRQRGSAIAEAA
jgi:magnesium chelatase family protein